MNVRIVAFVTLLLACLLIHAQDRDIPRATLPEDSTLSLLFNSLEKSLKEQDYGTASETVSAIQKFFQEKGSNFVVQVGSVYYGAPILLKRLLAAVPEESLKDFSSEIYKSAEILLKGAQNDPPSLWKLFDRLASLNQIQSALKSLLQYHIERGEFESALKAVSLAYATIDNVENEQLRFYIAISLAASGRTDEAEKEIAKIKGKIRFAAKEQDAKESFTAFLKSIHQPQKKTQEPPKVELPGTPRYTSLESVFGPSELKIAGAPSIPTTYGETILVNTGKTVYRLKDGRILWSVPLVTDDIPQAYYYSRTFKPATDGTCVYFSDKDRVRAHRLDDGSFIWCTDPIANALVLSEPAVSGSDVFVYALTKEREFKSFLFCFDSKTGEQKWFSPVTTGFPLNPFNSCVFASPPIVVGDKILILSGFEIICAFSRTGQLIWAYRYPTAYSHLIAKRTAENKPRFVANPLVVGDTVIAVPSDSLYAFAFSMKSPRILWRMPTEGDWTIIGLCTIETPKTKIAFFGSHIIIVDPESGLIEKLIPLPSLAHSALAERSSILLLSEKRLFRYKFDTDAVEELFLPELNETSNLAESGGSLVAVSPNSAVFWQPLKEEKELLAIRKGNIEPLLESLKQGSFGTSLQRTDLDENAILAPIIEHLRKNNPLKCAQVLVALSERSSVERSGSLLLDAALLYHSANEYEKSLETLALSVSRSAEAIELRSLNILPMPQTATALSLLIAKSSPKDVLKKFEERAEKTRKDSNNSSDLMKLFYSYPYTQTGKEAALESARQLIAEKRTEEAEKWILSLLRLGIDDELRLKLLEIVARIYQMVGDEIRLKWANSATQALKNGKPIPQQNAPLWLPNKIAWRTLPYLVTDEPMDAILIKNGNRAAILRFGKTVMDAVDAENGFLLWRVGLNRCSSPVQLPDGKIAVLSNELLAVLDSETGDLLKKIKIENLNEKWKEEASFMILPIKDDKVCLLDKDGNTTIVDLKNERVIRCETILKQSLSGVLVGKVASNNDIIGVISGDFKKLILFDASKAVVVKRQEAGKNEFFFDIRASDKAVFCLTHSSGGGSLSAYNSTGALLWTTRIDSATSEIFVLSDGSIVTLPANFGAKPTICAIEPNGKKKWSYEIDSQIQWVRTAECHDKLAVLLRRADKQTECLILNINTGNEQGRVASAIERVNTFFGTGHFAVAVEQAFYIHSVEIIDVRRVAATGTIVRLDASAKTAFTAAGRIVVMSEAGSLVVFDSDIGAASDAADGAANLLLTPSSPDAVAKYSLAVTLLRSPDAAVNALNDFIEKNTLHDNPSKLRHLQNLIAELGFSAAVMRPPTINIEYTKHPPTIDGLLEDEWQRAKPIELNSPKSIFPIQNKKFLSYRWFAKEDLSAKLYLMWDEKALYFLLDVSDQCQRPFDDSQEQEYSGDVLYVAIEDVLIYMGLMLPQIQKDKDKDEEARKPKGKYMSLHKKDNSGFVYEGELPWEYLKSRGVNLPEKGASAGVRFKINFVVIDDDTGIGSEKTLNLTPGLVCGRRDAVWRGFVREAFATAVLKK